MKFKQNRKSNCKVREGQHKICRYNYNRKPEFFINRSPKKQERTSSGRLILAEEVGKKTYSQLSSIWMRERRICTFVFVPLTKDKRLSAKIIGNRQNWSNGRISFTNVCRRFILSYNVATCHPNKAKHVSCDCSAGNKLTVQMEAIKI